MSDRSKIEWTDATWNPIRARAVETGKVGWHCEHVSEGCRNCYAESLNRRLGTGLKYQTTLRTSGKVELYLDEKALLAPLHWRKPRRVFVCSMTDLYGSFIPDEWIDRIKAVIALCPQHIFMELTKRPERMREYYASRLQHGESLDTGKPDWAEAANYITDKFIRPLSGDLYLWGEITGPLPNLWLGVSAEDQATLDARAPHLLATPAALRFLSLEPLLGAVNARWIGKSGGTGPALNWKDALTGAEHHGASVLPRETKIDWVILGGESGPGARPMHPDWARQVRDQCAAAGVAFFFKQWGEWVPETQATGALTFKGAMNALYIDADGKTRPARSGTRGDAYTIQRVGKKAAGALLDGREHKNFP